MNKNESDATKIDLQPVLQNKNITDKIRASFGGRLRMILTGSAPVSAARIKFLKAVLDCKVFEA